MQPIDHFGNERVVADEAPVSGFSHVEMKNLLANLDAIAKMDKEGCSPRIVAIQRQRLRILREHVADEILKRELAPLTPPIPKEVE